MLTGQAGMPDLHPVFNYIRRTSNHSKMVFTQSGDLSATTVEVVLLLQFS